MILEIRLMDDSCAAATITYLILICENCKPSRVVYQCATHILTIHKELRALSYYMLLGDFISAIIFLLLQQWLAEFYFAAANFCGYFYACTGATIFSVSIPTAWDNKLSLPH